MQEEEEEDRQQNQASWKAQSLHDLMNNPRYTTVMLAAAVFFLMSIFIHFPLSNSPRYYSDIVDTFWYGRAPQGGGLPFAATGIPYVTYFFEYPPICGLILWLGGWGSGGSAQLYAAIEFGILLLFFLMTTHFTYQFLENLGLGHTKQIIFSIFAPSVLFYGAYNFDIVQTAFVIASLYFFVARKNSNLAAIFLGLSISTKLSPIFLIPLFWQEMKGNAARLRFTILTAAVVAATNVPFIIANYNLWYQSYRFLASWGLEDSFLVWIFPNPATWNLAKDVSLALLGISAISIYIFLRGKPLLVRAFLITGIFLLFSYIATPQMNLDLLPFFALVPVVPLSLFYLFDITDVAIILTWFIFQNSTLPGFTQTFALLRQIYLAVILGLVAFTKHSPKPRT
ncbi:MAG TPA: hypothetical protein VFF30_11425 [Nitrososphaerales archaeon]|nr:hypothetical protein [Nitrososphaerales archaeon]